ncbi:MAG: hypothetical protein KKD63_03155, partial [Proteobacteria bacterium]|nr:hypothetical protein [Pseudomonadota bacterium]
RPYIWYAERAKPPRNSVQSPLVLDGDAVDRTFFATPSNLSYLKQLAAIQKLGARLNQFPIFSAISLAFDPIFE